MPNPIPTIEWTVRSERLRLSSPQHPERFCPSDPAETFLRYLIGVASSNAPHIHPDDAPRYIAMMHDLLRFEPPIWGRRTDAASRVEDMTIAGMYHTTLDWIESCLAGPRPLASSWALDAVEFISCHIRGEHLGRYNGDYIQLQPLLIDPSDDALLYGDRINAQLKKEVTEKDVGGLLVRARVSAEARLVDVRNHFYAIADDTFMFRIRRCHLSSSVYENGTVLEAEIPEHSGIDLGRDFRFYGFIPFTTRPWPTHQLAFNALPDNLSPYLAKSIDDASYQSGLALFLPGRWITHTLNRQGQFEKVPAFNGDGFGNSQT